MKVLDHVMPREKRCGALDSCFGLVGPHQQSIPQLLSLASRVYKGYHLLWLPEPKAQRASGSGRSKPSAIMHVFTAYFSNAVVLGKSPFIFLARVVLKALVSLIGHLKACSARIRVDAQIDKQTTVTLTVHALRGLTTNSPRQYLIWWEHVC